MPPPAGRRWKCAQEQRGSCPSWHSGARQRPCVYWQHRELTPAPPVTHLGRSGRRPPSPTLQALPCPLGSEPSCSPSPTSTTSSSAPFLAHSLLGHSEMSITHLGPPRGPRPCRATHSGGPACVGPSTDSAPGTGSTRAAGGHLDRPSRTQVCAKAQSWPTPSVL